MNTHSCDFSLDLDGQVTCATCGAMETKPDIFESQVDFE
jgi:hypothetical protein